jgi:hypothetical protein
MANQTLFDSVPFDQSTFGGNLGSIPCMPVQNALYIAFREARILLRPQALNSNNELADGLIFLNQLVDYWAARACYAWTTTFTTWTLSPGHQPHLIGPNLVTPDFAVNTRPVSIRSANLILTDTNPPVDQPINIRDSAWWAAQRVKGIQTSIPTDLYYEPDVPNGQLWFWPIPNTGYGLRLEGMVVLQQFQSLTDCFIAPQAYLAAVALTLAEELSDIWGTTPPPNLARRALKARDALQSNNNLAPRISSADWGTSTSPSAGDFNYMTGTLP